MLLSQEISHYIKTLCTLGFSFLKLLAVTASPIVSSSLPQAFTKQQPWQNRLFDLYTLSVASCLFSESHAHSIAHLQTEKAFLKQPKVFLR